MHRIVLLSLIFIQFTDALTCIDGFTQVNNKCIRLLSIDSARDDARRQCNLFGGNIVSIHNSIDNTAIAKFAFTSSDPIWIGLKCSVDHTPSSCIWDDQLGNVSTYSDFISGNPSTTIGQCVYMLTTGALRGKWLSGDCDTARRAVCETDPIGQCSHPFDRYCYLPLGELSIAEARSACAQNCNGDLVSIHSSPENDHVASLFKDPSIPYFRIGAQLWSNASHSWTDKTNWDYTNVGYQSYGYGSCFSMSLENEIVAPGKWISSDCVSQLPSVCKWLPSSSCALPTSAPPQCTGPTYLTDTGKIYSPNYPFAYTATDTSPCYYILTTTSYRAALWFDDFELDSDSSLELYSSVEGGVPFLILDQSKQGKLNDTIISSTNVIKIIFKPCTQNCDQSRNYKWSARFGKYYGVTCNYGMYSNSVFTSYYYPNPYLKTTCTYPIYSYSGRRIQLHFDSFDTQLNADYFRIYDGPNTGYPLIAILSGDLRGSNLTFTSSSSSMYLTFTPTSSIAHTGFLARFNDYP